MNTGGLMFPLYQLLLFNVIFHCRCVIHSVSFCTEWSWHLWRRLADCKDCCMTNCGFLSSGSGMWQRGQNKLGCLAESFCLGVPIISFIVNVMTVIRSAVIHHATHNDWTHRHRPFNCWLSQTSMHDRSLVCNDFNFMTNIWWQGCMSIIFIVVL